MLKKKWSVLVVLAMVFAMVFGACGEAGGDAGGPGVIEDVVTKLEPGSHGTAGDMEITGLVSGETYVIFSADDELWYAIDKNGLLIGDGFPQISDVAEAGEPLDPGKTKITGLDNGKSYSVFNTMLVSGSNVTIGANGSDFNTDGKNFVITLSANPFTISPGVGGAAEGARTTLIFYWSGRAHIGQDYDEAVTDSTVLDADIDEDGDPAATPEYYTFSNTTSGTAKVMAKKGDRHFTIYNMNDVFTAEISY